MKSSLVGLGSVLFAFTLATGACFEDAPVGDDDVDSGGGGSSGGKECTSDSDCGANEGCAYAQADACTAKGQCVAEAATECLLYEAGCACDGTEINIACLPYPTGFESKPLAHAGSCADSGATDGGAGATDSGPGAACTSDSDCNANEGCAYLQADACSAQGQCVAEAATECAAFEAGCACDGTVINIGCTPYPMGYVSKPVVHAGNCADGGN